MVIKGINIKNFRSVKKLQMEFDPSLNVFVGVNGVGKTTILDALTISLSWLINRIQKENSSAKHISESDINNDSLYSFIETIVKETKTNFKWKLVKTKKGNSIIEKSDLLQVSDLADYFRTNLKNDNSLPVIVYYPVNRVVKDISPEISNKENFYTLDVYENAIGGKTNFQSFFEWFRMQDDILNEKLGSRTKWMRNNKKWLKKRTEKIISHLVKLTNEHDEFNYLVKRLKNDDILYEEPRFLFHELIDLLHSIEYKFKKEARIELVLHDIEYFLHKMSSLSDSKRDNLISPEKFPNHVLERIFEQLDTLMIESNIKKEKKYLILFIWESLLFSILLSLWWMSDKGKREIENLFKEYNPILLKNNKEWRKISKTFLIDIDQIIRNDANRQDIATRNQGREINIVAKTIENFIDGYTNLRIKRVPKPHMLLDKNGVTFNLEQLSDGEKNLIALVGDIARRLSIANPNISNPLKGNGIIFIDEIDLHLHPTWQRLIVPKLLSLFPNCQFFISTHSPQVLSHVKPNNIYLLKNISNELKYSKPTESYGITSNRILEDLLGVDARPKKEKNDLKKIYKYIQDNDLNKAKVEIEKLAQRIGNDTELVKARVLIKRKEIIGK